ncbi:major facilitator superfamily domain-containing protein [Dichotomocladium elegans]|nr:major facilitator superfamily domain-containing protein [Dichotomocladium elegans]
MDIISSNPNASRQPDDSDTITAGNLEKHAYWRVLEPEDQVDKDDERKVVRALDWHLLPLFCVFYFTDYLDRANIGNATIGGIQDDLKLSATQMSTIISAFYITYILFEVPSNIILKKTSGVIWLSTIMLAWGIITLVMGFIADFGGLLVSRLLLGAAESGYIPGMLYQLSRFYKPQELSSRIGILISMACIAGVASGPIAYATSFLEGHGGLHGWQYLFILEGAPTIALSAVSYFMLFDTVDQVSWLTVEQKQLQNTRMRKHHQDNIHTAKTMSWKTLWIPMADWKTWLFGLVYMINAINFASYSIFSPMLIDGFGFPVLTSQLLTAPPNVLAAAVMLLSRYLTDRYENVRAKVAMCGFITMAIGYTLLLVLHDRWSLYGALFIIPIGMSIEAPAVLGWSAVNYEDLSVRAVAVAIVVMVVLGNAFNMSCALLGATVSGLTGFLLYRENKRRDQMAAEDELGPAAVGDLSYRFYY